MHAHDFFGRTGNNRFDAPDGSYDILYACKPLAAAFSEVFLRDPPRDIVFLADLDARWRTTISHASLMVLPAFGPGLLRGNGALVGASANRAVAGTSERVDATPVPSLRFFDQLSSAAKYLK